jgi:hypothetical protein
METANLLSAFSLLSLWPAPHTPQQFSQKAQETDHVLCAYWTAGLTARPPDIGSASCYTIFQAINWSSRCILRPVWRLLLGFRMSLPIISGVTRATPVCTAFVP